MTKEERRAKYTEIARKRRQKQQGFRKNGRTSSSMVCYRCRQPGHTIANCPSIEPESRQSQPDKQESVGTLCYRCGSTEHTLSNCTKPRCKIVGDEELPFATCFLCKEKGHLVSGCPKNKRGIYVNGGSCRVCGSQQHRANDCPEKKRKKQHTENQDDDVSHLLEEPHPRHSNEEKPQKEKKKRRVVKF